MSYQREIIELGCAGIAQWNLCSKESAAEIAARADARIAELELDAARYRWLRRKVYVVGLHHLSDNDCGQFEFANLPRILEPMAGVSNAADALDAVIDAALSEVKS